MSPKNKGKFGKGKSAVELEDEFVSGVSQVAEKLKPHTKLIAVVTSVLAVILVGFYVYQYMVTRAETQATAFYRQALDAAQRPVQEPAEDEAEAPAEADEDAPFPSHQARAEAVLAPLEQLRQEHGSTRTARSVRLFHAATLYDAGRYQEAIELYQEILAGPPEPGSAAVAREGLGYAQEAQALSSEDQAARQAGLEQALETFRQIQPADEGPRREYALYHEARILATLGRRDEAVSALKQALEVAPDSPIRGDIRQRLAQLAE